MMRLDISRCFESIYTHSLSWAVRGKEFSKQNKQNFFFESEFDRRMREANWGETNGILIGPEVSRIFAEAILQAIDVEVAKKVQELTIKCEIRRYVDDFFIFSNTHSELLKVKSVIETASASYGLHLNENKTSVSERPFISKTSIARERVIRLLDELLRNTAAALDAEKPKHFSRKAVAFTAREVRNIAGLHETENALLASPALAVIERGLSRLRQRVEGKEVASVYGARIVHSYLRIATSFFLMDIRSSTSHKLSRIFLECSAISKFLGCGQLAFEASISDALREAVHLASDKGIHGPEIL
ncbi:RNA-directed DNA polymerase, partial [Candidatus Dojkabacteria bacterium]|nr:RNA-directed DNA polymerase [Candidatus Dojkabacteria bacterium]